MADLIKISIPGNKVAAYYAVNPPINHEDMYYFPVEREEIIAQGYKPEDYKIKAYYPGLRQRGSGKMPEKIISTLDGYELVLEKKNLYNSHMTEEEQYVEDVKISDPNQIFNFEDPVTEVMEDDFIKLGFIKNNKTQTGGTETYSYDLYRLTRNTQEIWMVRVNKDDHHRISWLYKKDGKPVGYIHYLKDLEKL